MATVYKTIDVTQFAGKTGKETNVIDFENQGAHFYLPELENRTYTDSSTGVTTTETTSTGYNIPNNDLEPFTGTRDSDNNKLFSISQQAIKDKLYAEELISKTELENGLKIPGLSVRIFSGTTPINDNRFLISYQENNIPGIYISLNPAFGEDVDGDYYIDLQSSDYPALLFDSPFTGVSKFGFSLKTATGQKIQDDENGVLFAGGDGLPKTLSITRDTGVNNYYITVMAERGDYLYDGYTGKYPLTASSLIGTSAIEIPEGSDSAVLDFTLNNQFWNWSKVLYDDGSLTLKGSQYWAVVISTEAPVSGQTTYVKGKTFANTGKLEPGAGSSILTRTAVIDYSEEAVKTYVPTITLTNTGGTSTTISVYGRFRDNNSDEYNNKVTYASVTLSASGDSEGKDKVELKPAVSTKYIFIDSVETLEQTEATPNAFGTFSSEFRNENTTIVYTAEPAAGKAIFTFDSKINVQTEQVTDTIQAPVRPIIDPSIGQNSDGFDVIQENN